MATTSPDAAGEARAQARRATPGTSPWQKAIGIAGLVVVLWVGDNLFDTITSDGMGTGADPGGHAPPSGVPTTQPTDGDNPTPVGGNEGGHDPTQFDHG